MRCIITTLAIFVYLLATVNAAPERSVVDGVTYYILQTEPQLVDIIWKDSEGKKLRTIPAVAKHYSNQNIEINAIMNGGIFEPGGIPSGLLIQNGVELNPINRKDGRGNFFLKPNGIFLIHENGAAVIRTDEYPLPDTNVIQAVQSGPLLLRNGNTHPVFKKDSKYRLHRNGIGVSKSGKVILAITDIDSPKFPNLYEFAELFRTLGCNDALFLDGEISQLKTGATMLKVSNGFASFIILRQPQ